MAETYTSLEFPRDWRGVPILIGATVIYGAPVGRSIAMVEGIVDSFTKSGRVNVRIVRRAYGSWGDSKPVVHVGQDRVTVVTQMPPPLMPTEAEKKVVRDEERAERDRIHATHDVRDVTTSSVTGRLLPVPTCVRCNATYRDLYVAECVG